MFQYDLFCFTILFYRFLVDVQVQTNTNTTFEEDSPILLGANYENELRVLNGKVFQKVNINGRTVGLIGTKVRSANVGLRHMQIVCEVGGNGHLQLESSILVKAIQIVMLKTEQYHKFEVSSKAILSYHKREAGTFWLS